MLTFIKLGGSLITDKRVKSSFRADVVTRLAQEIAAALQTMPDLRLLVGHGSGSFGHFAASKYNTIRGVQTAAEWRGFAEVAHIAAELNHLVSQTFQSAGIAVWRIQPSASARCHDGELREMAVHPIEEALKHGIVPLVYGDVALDSLRGGTIISTEAILSYLATRLPVQRILLLGETPGVLDASGTIIAEINPSNIAQYNAAIGGSSGTDVTGGMLTKVGDMLTLVERFRELTIRIMSGIEPGLLQRTLQGKEHPGTLIRNSR